MGRFPKPLWREKKPGCRRWTAASTAPNARCVWGGGVPVAPLVAGADHNDFKRLEKALQNSAQQKPALTDAIPRHMLLDKGHDYAEVRAILHPDRFCPLVTASVKPRQFRVAEKCH